MICAFRNSFHYSFKKAALCLLMSPERVTVTFLGLLLSDSVQLK